MNASQAVTMPAKPTYQGNDKLLVGIVLGVLTFWMFAGTVGTVARTIGSNPLVIDFCLIGFAGTATVPAPARHHSHSGGHHKDQHIVEAEMGWFTSSKFSVTGDKPPYPVCIPSNTSNPGLMVYWPILSLAAGIAPTSTSGSWPTPPSSATISVEPGSGNYNYAGLIPAIYAALTNNPSGIPNCPGSISSITDAIIYVHCDSGVNRTGAAVAGYLMTYGSNAAGYGLSAAPATPYTLQQAQNAANKFHPGNDPQPYGGVDIPVAEAYCQMINSSDKKTISGPLNANCVPLSNT